MSRDAPAGLGGWLLPLLVMMGLAGGAAATRIPPPANASTGAPIGTVSHVATPSANPAHDVLEGLLEVAGGSRLVGPSDSLRDVAAKARDAATRRNISVQFVVTILPDYVDSSSRWTFDPSLDALQRAAGAADFALDRFYLPDWPATDGTDTAKGRKHEQQPGLVLFRKVDDTSLKTNLLALFVVTETPTAGIHESAFLAAADFVAGWHRNETYSLSILGPTFSGSSPSLRRAIHTFLESAPNEPEGITILSGAATSQSNQGLLTFDWPSRPPWRSPTRVTFAATVRSDDVMLEALGKHLRANGHWVDETQVALLVESNTSYGQGFGAVEGSHEDGNPDDTRDGNAPDGPFSKALRIPFPIHISRLRAEAERARTRQERSAEPRRGAELRDSGPAFDHIPSMTPQLTAATIDTLVDSIFATIRRGRFTAIGIFATDKRDHLFLAERIVRAAPNALIFTTEADLIYVYPEFRSYVRGAVVASSYPLFTDTQVPPMPNLAGRARQQFASMGAQGTYNALLMLLERDELLLDYVPPDCPAWATRLPSVPVPPGCHQPPVWISVVGHDGFWPIEINRDADPTRAVRDAPYTANINWSRLYMAETTRREASTHGDAGPRIATGDGPARSPLHWPTWMTPVLGVLFLAIVAHLIFYLNDVEAIQTSGTTWPANVLRGLPIIGWRPSLNWTPIGRMSAHMTLLTERARSQIRDRAQHLPGARVMAWSTGDAPGEADNRAVAAERRQFALIALAILCFASFWATQLLAIWASALSSRWVAPLVTEWFGGQSQATADHIGASHPIVRGLMYCVLAAPYALMGLLFVESFRAIRHRHRAVKEGAAGGTTVTLVALGLAAWTGHQLLTFLRPLGPDQTDMRLLFLRTAHPGNWVSPAASVLLLLGVLYLWALWNLHQLAMGGWRCRRNSELFQLLVGREPDLVDEVADIMASPWRRQRPWCLMIPFALLGFFFLYVPTWYTPDGRSFEGFVRWGSLLVMFLIVHLLAMTVHLGLLIRRILRHLLSHPIASAFARVADEPFKWQLSLTPPTVAELGPMARRARALQLHLLRLISDASVIAVRPTVDPATDRRRQHGRSALHEQTTTEDDLHIATSAASVLNVRRSDVVPISQGIGGDLPSTWQFDDTPGNFRSEYFRSQTWAGLVDLSNELLPILHHGFWNRAATTTRRGQEDWYLSAETLVGMQAAFVLRDLLARLVSGMTVTIVGGMLALTSHLFYSFPGRWSMLAFDWIVLALAVTTSAALLIQLERDTILSRLWAKTPGRLIWTGGFVYRVALYGAAPVVTLFAWQFPEVAGTLFSWMEPLQQAVP